MRVSISSPEDLACSGLIYAGVPRGATMNVKIVSAVSLCVSALAIPTSQGRRRKKLNPPRVRTPPGARVPAEAFAEFPPARGEAPCAGGRLWLA